MKDYLNTKKPKKLALNLETLRSLTDSELEAANGSLIKQDDTSPTSRYHTWCQPPLDYC